MLYYFRFGGTHQCRMAKDATHRAFATARDCPRAERTMTACTQLTVAGTHRAAAVPWMAHPFHPSSPLRRRLTDGCVRGTNTRMPATMSNSPSSFEPVAASHIPPTKQADPRSHAPAFHR